MSTHEAVQRALTEIPAKRDALDARDDEISEAIRTVEVALRNLKLGIAMFLPVTFIEGDWERDLALGWSKVNGAWSLSISEVDDDVVTTLLGGSRSLRAFMTKPDDDGLSPIERLIVTAPQALERALVEQRATEPLRRLIDALKAAKLL